MPVLPPACARKSGRDRQENGGERKNVEQAESVAEKNEKCAGVGRVADKAVRAGGHEFVVRGDRNVDGEEAAEIDDGGPAYD